MRTSVYAFDKCIIGALGAVTTPLAGLLAEKAFGFVHMSSHKKLPAGGHAPAHAHAPAAAVAAAATAQHANNLNNARALENGLLCIMLVCRCAVLSRALHLLFRQGLTSNLLAQRWYLL